jgi:hypothetical protein
VDQPPDTTYLVVKPPALSADHSSDRKIIVRKGVFARTRCTSWLLCRTLGRIPICHKPFDDQRLHWSPKTLSHPTAREEGT